MSAEDRGDSKRSGKRQRTVTRTALPATASRLLLAAGDVQSEVLDYTTFGDLRALLQAARRHADVLLQGVRHLVVLRAETPDIRVPWDRVEADRGVLRRLLRAVQLHLQSLFMEWTTSGQWREEDLRGLRDMPSLRRLTFLHLHHWWLPDESAGGGRYLGSRDNHVTWLTDALQTSKSLTALRLEMPAPHDRELSTANVDALVRVFTGAGAERAPLRELVLRLPFPWAVRTETAALLGRLGLHEGLVRLELSTAASVEALALCAAHCPHLHTLALTESLGGGGVKDRWSAARDVANLFAECKELQRLELAGRSWRHGAWGRTWHMTSIWQRVAAAAPARWTITQRDAHWEWKRLPPEQVDAGQTLDVVFRPPTGVQWDAIDMQARDLASWFAGLSPWLKAVSSEAVRPRRLAVELMDEFKLGALGVDAVLVFPGAARALLVTFRDLRIAWHVGREEEDDDASAHVLWTADDAHLELRHNHAIAQAIWVRAVPVPLRRLTVRGSTDKGWLAGLGGEIPKQGRELERLDWGVWQRTGTLRRTSTRWAPPFVHETPRDDAELAKLLKDQPRLAHLGCGFASFRQSAWAVLAQHGRALHSLYLQFRDPLPVAGGSLTSLRGMRHVHVRAVGGDAKRGPAVDNAALWAFAQQNPALESLELDLDVVACTSPAPGALAGRAWLPEMKALASLVLQFDSPTLDVDEWRQTIRACPALVEFRALTWSRGARPPSLSQGDMEAQLTSLAAEAPAALEVAFQEHAFVARRWTPQDARFSCEYFAPRRSTAAVAALAATASTGPRLVAPKPAPTPTERTWTSEALERRAAVARDARFVVQHGRRVVLYAPVSRGARLQWLDFRSGAAHIDGDDARAIRVRRAADGLRSRLQVVGGVV